MGLDCWLGLKPLTVCTIILLTLTYSATSPRHEINTRDTLCLQPPSFYTTGHRWLRSKQKVYFIIAQI